MLSRRTLLIGTGVAAAGAGAAYYMWPGVDPRYQEILDETHKRVESWPQDKRALSVQLIRHATLAANSHNTQPWLFEVGGNKIRIRADADRRCPVVDPDDRHVIASLGCATENLVFAWCWPVRCRSMRKSKANSEQKHSLFEAREYESCPRPNR